MISILLTSNYKHGETSFNRIVINRTVHYGENNKKFENGRFYEILGKKVDTGKSWYIFIKKMFVPVYQCSEFSFSTNTFISVHYFVYHFKTLYFLVHVWF